MAITVNHCINQSISDEDSDKNSETADGPDTSSSSKDSIETIAEHNLDVE
jgi:hypothetical protein